MPDNDSPVVITPPKAGLATQSPHRVSVPLVFISLVACLYMVLVARMRHMQQNIWTKGRPQEAHGHTYGHQVSAHELSFSTCTDYLECRPFVCEYCFKSFSQRSGLTTHVNTQYVATNPHFEACSQKPRCSTGAKPYACKFEGCSARFGDPSSCARHKKETHRVKHPYRCCHPGCISRYMIYPVDAFCYSSCLQHQAPLGLQKPLVEEARH